MLGFVWHSSQKRRAHLKPIKTTAVIYLGNLLLLLLYFLLRTLALLCPDHATRPVSFWTPISLFSCHAGKQNAVAMETACRDENSSLWDFQCGNRSPYMVISCLLAGGGSVHPSMKMLSLSFIRQMKWQTEWRAMKRRERRKKKVWPLLKVNKDLVWNDQTFHLSHHCTTDQILDYC